MKTSTAILLFLVAGGSIGCGSSPTQATPPPTPTPTPTRQTPVIAQFTDTDPNSTVMTPDVRDSDRQIVRFDTANHELIWTADGRTFSGFSVNGNFINVTFQVRFGKEDGEGRAYFTETARPFLCNIEIVNGQVIISPTDVPVPGGG